MASAVRCCCFYLAPLIELLFNLTYVQEGIFKSSSQSSSNHGMPETCLLDDSIFNRDRSYGFKACHFYLGE